MRRPRFVPLTENEEDSFDFAVEIAIEGGHVKAFVAKGERSIARVEIELTKASGVSDDMVRDAGKAIERLADVVPLVVERQVALSSRSEPIGPRDLWSLDRELRRGLARAPHQGLAASDEELAWWARGFIEVAARHPGSAMTKLAEITQRDRVYVQAKIARAVERKLLPKGGPLGPNDPRRRLAEPKATKKLERIEAKTRETKEEK